MRDTPRTPPPGSIYSPCARNTRLSRSSGERPSPGECPLRRNRLSSPQRSTTLSRDRFNRRRLHRHSLSPQRQQPFRAIGSTAAACTATGSRARSAQQPFRAIDDGRGGEGMGARGGGRSSRLNLRLRACPRMRLAEAIGAPSRRTVGVPAEIPAKSASARRRHALSGCSKVLWGMRPKEMNPGASFLNLDGEYDEASPCRVESPKDLGDFLDGVVIYSSLAICRGSWPHGLPPSSRLSSWHARGDGFYSYDARTIRTGFVSPSSWRLDLRSGLRVPLLSPNLTMPTLRIRTGNFTRVPSS